MILELNIPNDKAQRIGNAFKALNPVPLDNEGQPLFNDLQWFKRCLRNHIIRTVARAERMQAVIDAYQEDESLVEE
jgi:hypothetical protein